MIVDDEPVFCSHWEAFFEHRYPGRTKVETYVDPLDALGHLSPDIRLLMLDLEMPVMDGKKLLAYSQPSLAVSRGVERKRIVISSARDADHLHRVFPSGECLAVINKDEPAQQAVFLMILDSVMRKP